jgi:hypothetical protein
MGYSSPLRPFNILDFKNGSSVTPSGAIWLAKTFFHPARIEAPGTDRCKKMPIVSVPEKEALLASMRLTQWQAEALTIKGRGKMRKREFHAYTEAILLRFCSRQLFQRSFAPRPPLEFSSPESESDCER